MSRLSARLRCGARRCARGHSRLLFGLLLGSQCLLCRIEFALHPLSLGFEAKNSETELLAEEFAPPRMHKNQFHEMVADALAEPYSFIGINLKYRPTGAKVHVSDFGVAHLLIG